MRITVPMLVTVSLLVTTSMFSMVGYADLAGGAARSPGLSEQADDLERRAGNYSADRASQQGSYLGFTVEAVSGLVDILKWNLALPFALTNLGIPQWAAYPFGVPLQLINYVGIYQIIRGMRIS